MFFVNGPPLTKFIKPSNKMSVYDICTKIATICDAIHYAHQRGVIHRDIKASNIMMDKYGKPYITDFGIAKWERSLTQTEPGALMGSPQYMPPEQVEGHILDARSDIYSLGVTLYILLTQRYPFEGKTAMSILARRLSQEPTPPERYHPDMPPMLSEIISKTLQPDRRDRYQTAAELSDCLTEFVQSAKRAGVPKSSGPPRQRQGIKPDRPMFDKRWLIAMFAVLSMAITVAPFLSVKQEDFTSSSQVDAFQKLSNQKKRTFSVPKDPTTEDNTQASNSKPAHGVKEKQTKPQAIRKKTTTEMSRLAESSKGKMDDINKIKKSQRKKIVKIQKNEQ
jgi:serine/threonine protein kinase